MIRNIGFMPKQQSKPAFGQQITFVKRITEDQMPATTKITLDTDNLIIKQTEREGPQGNVLYSLSVNNIYTGLPVLNNSKEAINLSSQGNASLNKALTGEPDIKIDITAPGVDEDDES